MGKIIIVGLGPADYDSLTIKTAKILKSAKCLILRTEKHPLINDLIKEGINFQSCDDIYETSEDFDEVYERISDRVIHLSKENSEIVYAVPGHPFTYEKSVQLIIEKSKGVAKIQLESALSFIDALSVALKVDLSSGIKIIDGLRMEEQKPDVNCANIITQVYNDYIASEVKLSLMDYYKDEQEICIIKGAGAKDLESIQWVELHEVDKIGKMDYLTSIYIPKVEKDKKYSSVDDLVTLIKVLRGENGCPWDKKQDHNTLKPYLIEECYEVIDAIDKNDTEAVVEELGDVLLQVLLHAQIGKEDGEFDLRDIATVLNNKLVNRHPHVFGSASVSDETGAKKSWEESKKEEKGIKRYSDILIDIPKAMPSLTRSYKIQEKAALAGFDWDDVTGAMNKVDEELTELKEVYKSSKIDRIIEETGDLLFSVVNVARFLKIQPELALNATIEKFINRFELMEEIALSLGKNLAIMTLHEMDMLWNKAKTHEITKNNKNSK
ncbi:MAG: nucleoside triphosphate pyrophosphohydrolase [Clostridiales bacterium]|nr:nucleoside triphosphate pyrophosphohydrolase [Clostridiales bacterium]